VFVCVNWCDLQSVFFIILIKGRRDKCL
jgi:hypothetical protein